MLSPAGHTTIMIMSRRRLVVQLVIYLIVLIIMVLAIVTQLALLAIVYGALAAMMYSIARDWRP